MKTTIVIFGASGDLASRKLIPALYSNFRKGRLPEDTSIVGFSRRPFSDDAFREKMKEGLLQFLPSEFNEQEWGSFARMLSYHQGDIDRLEDFRTLSQKIGSAEGLPGNYLFHLAVAPAFYINVVQMLHEAKLLTRTGRAAYRRVIIEKPFGHDLPSALELNSQLLAIVNEDQIYRIDHYLGKETVQNLLVFRFGNAIFEPIWNRRYIEHVQITVAETVGVEHRASYYDKAGVLRDMFQNHLLQLLTLVAMEPPAVVEANSLRDEKVKVLRAIRELAPEKSSRFTVRGQYEGYRNEPGVDPQSTTETYAAIELFVDNWRWQGVPFYLRSGKMLSEKVSQIAIRFGRPPYQMFDVLSGATQLSTNHLSICIQPDEGFHLSFMAKVPDGGMSMRPADMDFHFRDSFRDQPIPDSYERLLLDALNGDPSLFTRSDEIEQAWKFIDSVRAGWEGEHAAPLEQYVRRSWGPPSADKLLWANGRWWRQDCIGRSEKGREHVD
ncbi:MAG TPA: glucose-6-phosphate dehydrogenase [Bacteroidota bacterium]